MNKPLKIIALPTDDGGCGNYRIRQPLELIRKHTKSDTHIIDKEQDNMVDIIKALAVADIVVMRPGSEIGMESIKEQVEKYNTEIGKPGLMKAKWVLDIDDNIELISPYSLHYENYGVENVKHNGKWLWKDGAANFDIETNKQRVMVHINGMKIADAVTVTTEKLRQYALQYNKNVYINCNAIRFDRWMPLNLKPNKQLRVGWTGGVSHYEDWFSIKEPLNKLMREFQFKLVMQGSDFSGVVEDDNKHLVEVREWIPFKGHPYMTATLALDVAVIPLADLPFNHYKSSIKWYEFSSLKVPSVVSNILPYSEDVNKTNAIPYSNPKEFETGLRMALVKPDARKKIGLEAYKWVKTNRDAVNHAIILEDTYKKICK